MTRRRSLKYQNYFKGRRRFCWKIWWLGGDFWNIKAISKEEEGPGDHSQQRKEGLWEASSWRSQPCSSGRQPLMRKNWDFESYQFRNYDQSNKFYLGLPFACMLKGSARIRARTQYWGAVAESQFGCIRTLGIGWIKMVWAEPGINWPNNFGKILFGY